MDGGMEEFRYRTKARIVACVNLTLLVVSVFMSVIIKDTTVDENSFVTQVFNNKDEGKDEDVLTAVALFVFAVAILLLVLGFCAAVKLLRSTDKGRDPKEALALAQFWQIVNLIYILLGCLELVMFRSFWYVSVQLFLLGSSFCFWYIVSRFMDELKQAIAVMKSTMAGEVDATTNDSMI